MKGESLSVQEMLKLLNIPPSIVHVFKENGNSIETGNMGATSTHQPKWYGSCAYHNHSYCLLAIQKKY